MKIKSELLRRDVTGWGQGRVAKKLGVTPSTMSNKMKAPEMLRLREFVTICEILGESPDRYFVSAASNQP